MYRPFDLSGHVALVTGGNGGIGLGMAEALCQAGADVVVWGTNADKNARALEHLQAQGTKVVTRIVDITDEQAVIDGMSDLIETMGRLDSCFANAGTTLPAGSMLDIDSEKWRRVMAINLDGAFWTMREACRHMKARAEAGDPGGSIVAVSSLAYNFGAVANEHYGASKMGMVGITKGIAAEFGRYGIRANSLLPGWTRSELTSPLQDDDTFNRKAISRVPLRRWGTGQDFGGIAVYLASTASSFHTGDAILIDGGYSAF